MIPSNSQRIRRGFVWLAAGAATLGIGVGAAGLASAASNTDGSTSTTVVASTSDSSTDTLAPPTGDAPADPATMTNGPGETLLTGDTLAKVTAAAEAAEPGATIVRAETDSSGHAYEVHVKLADGTYETLYFDESFVADGSETGFGPGGPGGDHQGQPPAGQPPAAPTDSSTTTG